MHYPPSHFTDSLTLRMLQALRVHVRCSSKPSLARNQEAASSTRAASGSGRTKVLAARSGRRLTRRQLPYSMLHLRRLMPAEEQQRAPQEQRAPPASCRGGHGRTISILNRCSRRTRAQGHRARFRYVRVLAFSRCIVPNVSHTPSPPGRTCVHSAVRNHRRRGAVAPNRNL